MAECEYSKLFLKAKGGGLFPQPTISLVVVFSKALHRPALRKPRTSPKLLSRLRPCFHSTNHQRATAFRALPLGCRITSALEVLHMLAVSGEGWRATAGLQGVQHGVDFSRAEYCLLE